MSSGVLVLVLVASAGTMPGPADALAGVWRFSNGAEFPGASGRLDARTDRITLHYDFRGGGNYVAAYCDLNTPQHVQSFRLRLQKPRDATITIRVVDHAGQTFQKSASYDDADRELLVHLRSWASSWGGPQDGILRQPVHTLGILIERQGLPDDEGSIAFTRPELVSVASGTQEQAPGSQLRSYLVTDFGADCPLARSAGVSGRAGVWHVDFAAAPQAALHGSVSLFHRPSTVTLRVRASAPGAVLVLHVGAHFQNFRRTVGTLDGTDQEFTVTLPPAGWEASGAAHQSLQYPLRITRIEVQRGTCASDGLDIALQGLSCSTTVDPAAATVLTSRLTAAASAGDQRQLTLDCAGWNLLEEPLASVLKVNVRNWDGLLLQAAELPIQLPGGGRRQDVQHRFTVPAAARYVEAAGVLESPGQQPAASSSTFTAALDEPDHTEQVPPPDPELRPESPWGMGIYLYRYPHSPSGLADMDRAAALAAAAGVKWTREEFSYGMIEKAPREYDFAFFDKVVDTAHRHGISV
ncbi:MAG: hypothetical protein MUF48_24190, partial [Pirellulaceae bacterium]|nr:hypothetical protein [Pirellulaceae bacterium]